MTSLFFIALAIVLVFTVGVASYVGANIAISKKRFVIHADKNRETITISPLNLKISEIPAEFLEEADQEQLDEMDMDPKWKKFLKRFIKVK